MKYLLLGGGGYLGTVLSDLLIDRNQEVIVYDKFEYSNPKELNSRCLIIDDNITNITNHLEKFSNVNFVFYMASPRFKGVRDDLHITSEILLMEHALKCVKKISPYYKLVFFSSCSVYGNTNEVVNEDTILHPTTMYSKLKIEGEKHILNSGYDNFIILRLATLYGLGIIDRDDLLINNIVEEVKKNNKIQIYEPEAYRPNLNVKDCSEIIYKLITQDIQDKIINVGFNEFNITKAQLINKIESSINKKIEVEYIDDGLEFRSYYVDFSRIKKYLNDFNPKSFERGIYDIFFKEKLLFGLEDYDSILQAPRPNGSSRSWYLEEEGTMDFPKMWGIWNLMDVHSNYKLFTKETFRDQTAPNFYSEYVDFEYKEKIDSKNYIYLICVFDPNFFTRNEKIGFSCISKKYIDDVKNGFCKIVLLNGIEGYIGCQNNNDLEILNKWIIDEGISNESVFLLSGNLIVDEVAKRKNINYRCIPISIFDNWVNYHDVKKMTGIIPFEPQEKNYLFLSYNRNVRPHRLQFLSKALFRNLLDLGKISLNVFPYNENLPDDDPYNLLQKRTPIIIDRPLDINWSISLDLEDHITTFMSVVTESLTEKDTLFLSEKIWKPISCGHPFMVLGGKGTLKKLKEFGFKTFDKWFDESYDEVEEYEIRGDMILNEVEKYKDKNINELKQIREEMKETCEYNQKRFLEMLTIKYTFNGENMNHFKEILSIINQIKLGII